MVTIHISNLFLQKASAVATFAFDSTNKNVMTSSTTGSFTLHEVKTHTYNNALFPSVRSYFKIYLL